MTPLSTSARIVDGVGRATRELTAFFQDLFNGTIQRQTYTAAELAGISPALGLTAFCSDSSVTTFNAVLAGGGANAVPVHGDGTNWLVG